MPTNVSKTGFGHHVVHFYDQDEELADGVGGFLAAAFGRGDAVIVVATQAHRAAFSRRLRAAGVDVDAARASGQFRALDAAETISRFVVDGAPDPALFDSTVGALVREAHVAGQQVCVLGEMVALLWAAGQVTAAMDLERLWNRLGDEEPLSLLCAYSNPAVADGRLLAEFEQICHLHSAVVGGPPSDVGRGALGAASRMFPHSDEAPRQARHFVVATLKAWGAGQLGDDAAVVVSELTTNAVVHARSWSRVVVSAGPRFVRISVADSSPVAPGCLAFTTAASSGRGLGLVSALSAQWGTTQLDEGKVVWAGLAGNAGHVPFPKARPVHIAKPAFVFENGRPLPASVTRRLPGGPL